MNSPYSKYQCYDIRTIFHYQPPELEVCIKCYHKLSRIKINRNTIAADKWLSLPPFIPAYLLSIFYCEKCQWWYFREHLQDLELWGAQDQEYITIGHKPSVKAEKMETVFVPWFQAFEDELLHENARKLPRSIGKKFPVT